MESVAIVMAIFAVVVIVVTVVFRQQIKTVFKGPGGMKFKLNASNPTLGPGVRAKNITSQKGGVTATDETGRGADVDKVNAHRDVNITSSLPQENLPPK